MRHSYAEMLGIDMRLLELERPDQPIQMMIQMRGWTAETRKLLAHEKEARSISKHAERKAR